MWARLVWGDFLVERRGAYLFREPRATVNIHYCRSKKMVSFTEDGDFWLNLRLCVRPQVPCPNVVSTLDIISSLHTETYWRLHRPLLLRRTGIGLGKQ